MKKVLLLVLAFAFLSASSPVETLCFNMEKQIRVTKKNGYYYINGRIQLTHAGNEMPQSVVEALAECNSN